jgi:GT2 family glycosyltransferase
MVNERSEMEFVCAVSVTYGDRFSTLMVETIRRIKVAGADHLVLVDNGSDEINSLKMDEMFCGDSYVTIIRLRSNSGSAEGFSRGMEKAAEMGFDLIWLLDDDNWVEADCLRSMLATRERSRLELEDPLVSVCGFRNLDEFHQRILAGKRAVDVFPPEGAFLFFDIHAYMKRKFSKKTRGDDIGDLCLPYAPYGGLLLRSEMLSIIGLPPKEYFLYADDTVWTERIVTQGHKIVLDLNARIVDADSKWSQGSGGGVRGILNSSSDERLFFSIRNRLNYDLFHARMGGVWIRFRFFLNMMVYLMVVFAVRVSSRKARLSIFFRALLDGWRMKFPLKDMESLSM